MAHRPPGLQPEIVRLRGFSPRRLRLRSSAALSPAVCHRPKLENDISISSIALTRRANGALLEHG